MADESRDALEDELREVEADIAEVRRDLDALRERIGDQADSPTDVEERAQVLTAVNEQEALFARLEERRAVLLRRLGTE